MERRLDDADVVALISRSLKRAREQKKISKRALADAAGVDPRHVHRWESGRAVPSITSLLTIAEALDVPLLSLLRDLDHAHRCARRDAERAAKSLSLREALALASSEIDADPRAREIADRNDALLLRAK